MPKPNYDFNLIVIGAGSAGLVSAYIASAVKAKVLLVEKSKMGGDCLNSGCVPSKSLIASAKLIHDINHSSELGIKSANAEFDFSDIMERVRKVITTIEPNDSVERYRSLGVDVIQGEAELISPTRIAVDGKTYTGKSIIIASGAKPFVPPIEGIDTISYLTSDNIWSLKSLPKRLIILGGGPIGCELAQAFCRLGSQVKIIEMLPNIIIREDEEVSQKLTEVLTREGVEIHTNHKALKFHSDANSKKIICQYYDDEVEFEFDEVLIAVGRSARIQGFGLEKLNIPFTTRHTIETDDYLQAGYPSVYACGDVTGPYQFTHVAAHQAWYAVVNALFRPFKRFRVDYRVIPWATYTDPEIARVGLNEQDAKAKNIPYEITHYDISHLDRALTDGHAKGHIKVLTVPGKDKILGATIMSRHAGDLIAEFVLAMKHNLGLNKILGTIHAYPTWMESNKFLAGNWKKNHAPVWALNLLEKFHQFRRR